MCHYILPIELPIGSYWLNCNRREPGWWGGGRGNFMYFKYNFSLDTWKTFLIYSSIQTFRYASFGCDAIGKISYR